MAWRYLSKTIWNYLVSTGSYRIRLPVLLIGGVVVFRGLLTWHKKRNKCRSHATGPETVISQGRALGYIERQYLEWNVDGFAKLSNVLLIATTIKLNTAIVEEALIRLADTHPLLKMRIAWKGKYPHFVPMNEFTIPLEESDSYDWKQVWEDDLLNTYDVIKGPLWRVKFLPNARIDHSADGYIYNCAVVFGFCHAIVDGACYMRLFDNFMTELAAVLNDLPLEKVPLPLLPPLDEFIEPTLSQNWWDTLCIWARLNIPVLRQKFLRSLLVPHPNLFVAKMSTEASRNHGVQTRTCFIPRDLNEIDTQTLLRACREHHVTIQAALWAAYGVAMARLFHDEGHLTSPLELVTGVTVNLRNRFDHVINPRHLGAYFSAVVFKVSVNGMSGNFWSFAKRCSKTLKASLAQEQYTGFYKYCRLNVQAEPTEKEKAFYQKQGEVYANRIESIAYFTNLGNCSFLNRSADSPVKLLARYGGSSEWKMGHVFGHNLATFEGKMYINIIHNTNVTSEETAKKYSKYFYDALQVATQF